MKDNKKICDVILLGNSKKFFKIFSTLYKNRLIKVIPWRRCNEMPNKNFNHFPGLIVICGYDYSSGLKAFDEFYNANVINPLNFLDHMTGPNTKLLYIDTYDSKGSKTYSRYRYAKNQLSQKLLKYEMQYKRLVLPVILDERGNADINGDLITTVIFNMLIRMKAIETVDMKKLRSIILNVIDSDLIPSPANLEGKFLKLRRTLFIDRLLRLICG